MFGSTTIRWVDAQMKAMSVSMFEVGLYRPALPDGTEHGPEMLLRTWDFDSVLRSIGWLRFENLRGRNIYIRPQGEHPLSLIDDLTFDAVAQMKVQGFQPAVVVETSPGNCQAWVNHGEVLSKELSSRAGRMLSQKFDGDPSSADWRHFGRLAGFTNRKSKHLRTDGLSPFVKLIEADGQVYPQAKSFIAQVREACAQAHRAAQQHEFTRLESNFSHVQTIADFRHKLQYQDDGNRIDLAYAIYALSHGVSESEVEAAVASRDLSHKGSPKRQADYIERTLQKAWGIIHGRTRER
jgi:hypothetical protein